MCHDIESRISAGYKSGNYRVSSYQGHVSYLEKAARLGRHLVVGLNSDTSVRKLKGDVRPLVHELDRARVLAALACVRSTVAQCYEQVVSDMSNALSGLRQETSNGYINSR